MEVAGGGGQKVTVPPLWGGGGAHHKSAPSYHSVNQLWHPSAPCKNFSLTLSISYALWAKVTVPPPWGGISRGGDFKGGGGLSATERCNALLPKKIGSPCVGSHALFGGNMSIAYFHANLVGTPLQLGGPRGGGGVLAPNYGGMFAQRMPGALPLY